MSIHKHLLNEWMLAKESYNSPVSQIKSLLMQATEKMHNKYKLERLINYLDLESWYLWGSSQVRVAQSICSGVEITEFKSLLCS